MDIIKYMLTERLMSIVPLRGRVNALSCIYCDEPIDMDFRAFGDQAERVGTKKDDLRWVEENRYSRHRGLKHILKVTEEVPTKRELN